MEQKAPRTITQFEAIKLLNELRRGNATGQSRRRGFRNYMAALFMLDAGLRVGEVIGLKISDLMIYEEPVLRLTIRKETTKTKHERTVPLSDRLRDAIGLCCNHYWFEPAKNACNPAVPGATPQEPMTIVQLERIIKMAAAASLYRRVTPHMLRHTFATRLMRKTNIRVVQELLGHKNLASTQIYTHPDQEDLDSAVKALGD